ncbi:MAG: hypothetical protein KKA67_12210, partial [Spirochaetes bacterium]|nr:hypothetical protein [Spirochaetota bacterium]
LERSEQTLRAGRSSYRVKGYWGLPEFDTPSFATEMMIGMCENAMAGLLTRRALVVNPGVGRTAGYIRARAKGATIDLCGRDSLALAASAANLGSGPAGARADGDSVPAPAVAAYAFTAELPDASYDLVAEQPDITPRVDTFDSCWSEAARVLKRGGSYVSAMPSAAMDRFEKRRPKGFVRVAERKKKGFACAAWRLES